MKKRFVCLLIVLAGVAGLIVAAKAETIDQLVVKVPFPFVAAGQTFPAGEYAISRVRFEAPGILLLSSRENRASGVMIRAQAQDPAHNRPKLAFLKVGDQHFLSQVETANYAYTVAVPSTEVPAVSSVVDIK